MMEKSRIHKHTYKQRADKNATFREMSKQNWLKQENREKFVSVQSIDKNRRNKLKENYEYTQRNHKINETNKLYL